MVEAVKGWRVGSSLGDKVKGAKGGMKRWLALNKKIQSGSKDMEEKLAALDLKAGSVGWSKNLRSERFEVVEGDQKGRISLEAKFQS